MESEEYYDSLDEGSDYENCDIQQTNDEDFLSTFSLPETKDDLIPFYDEQLSLSKIGVSKNSSTCSGFLSRHPSTSKSKFKNPILYQPRPKKSYLEMFYDRNGINKYELQEFSTDSARPNCSDSSPKSYITCMGDEECDNTTTVDFKDEYNPSFDCKDSSICVPKLNLEVEFGSIGDYKMYDREGELDTFGPGMKLTPNVPIIKMVSKATDTNLAKLDLIQSKASMENTNRTVCSRATDIKREKLEMIQLKLEQWKKRQEYGMKASESNRIKLQEKKALQILEKESKNSHKICI